MADNQSSSNHQDPTIPPTRLQHQHGTGFSRQQAYTKNTEYRSTPPQQHNSSYRPRYQQPQQQHKQQDRTESNTLQHQRDYNGGQYRSRNPTHSPQQQQQQRQMAYRPPFNDQWRPGSSQQNNYTRKPQPLSTPSKEKDSARDDGDLVKSMQALSTNDTSTKTSVTQDEMDDNNTVLECTATSLQLDELQAIIEKYESMRGGCRIQKIDDTKALVVFGHASTAKRAWTENKSNDKIKIQGYQGPMDIIEAIPIVRKSALNQRPRPTNMVAKRLIHGSLGLKVPAKTGSQRKTDQDTQDGRNNITPKR